MIMWKVFRLFHNIEHASFVHNLTFLKGRRRPFFDLVPSGKRIKDRLFSTTSFAACTNSTINKELDIEIKKTS